MDKNQFNSLIIRACKHNNHKGCYFRIRKIVAKYYAIGKPTDVARRTTLEALIEVYAYCNGYPDTSYKLERYINDIINTFDSQFGPDGLDTRDITDTLIVNYITLISRCTITNLEGFTPPLWYRLRYT